MRALLPRELLLPLLEKLKSRMEVVAPVLVEGTTVFATWKGQPLALEENPIMSPQEFLLPQREVLFRYIQDCGRYTFEQVEPRARLIFGIRPCDLRAVAVLDRIFGSKPEDSLYLDKRRSVILVGYNCLRPGQGCFCSALGSGPECGDPNDLQLTELKDGYLVESGSAAGVLIMKEHPEFFLEAQESHLSEKRALMKKAKEAMKGKEERSAAEIRELIKGADWDALGRWCLNCGSCTFVCPVCHCFNILDRGVPDGERMRCLDTCLLSGFSRMTSGSNPRISQGERMQNWYRDKFEYIPQKTGLVGCVGCGRCSRVCLAEMDRWKLEAKR